MTDFFNILTNQTLSLDALKASYKTNRCALPNKEGLSFALDFSSKLLKSQTPSLQALGFWLRKANLTKIFEENFHKIPQTLHVPVGVVFQIPPRNVDVLFGYTTLLSLLCGNITIARLWKERTNEQEELLTIMRELIKTNHKNMNTRLFLLTYEKTDTATEALSQLCNIRMVWGGDTTIQAIRNIPRPALARDIGFADRFSAALIKTKSFLTASEAQRDALIQDFARDLFTYDQMACTSPRILLWQGEDQQTKQATELFYPALAAHAKTKYPASDIGSMIAKNNAQFLALHDLDLEKKESFPPTLTILSLKNMDGFNAFKDTGFGHGMLFDYQCEDINTLSNYAAPKDQTLTHWGFDADEIKKLTQNTHFERYLPIGRSLDFDPIWDGCSLINEMTKLIRVTP